MIVSLDENGRLSLQDAANCRAFSFAGAAVARTESDAVRFDDGAAWVSEDALRAWPPLAADEAWQADVTAMIDYAEGKGWFDAQTRRIRAHIEQS